MAGTAYSGSFRGLRGSLVVCVTYIFSAFLGRRYVCCVCYLYISFCFLGGQKKMVQRIQEAFADYEDRLRNMLSVPRFSYGRGMVRKDGAPKNPVR